MALNDPLANALSNILNAEKSGKMNCIVRPSSALIKSVLLILKKHGYVLDFKETKNNIGNTLEVRLSGKIIECSVIRPRYPINLKNYE